jgi:hypothetical protein
MPNTDSLISIPFLGSGLGYRRPIKTSILQNQEQIDFLEIVTEQFLNYPAEMRELDEICDHFAVIPHGLGLSIGSAAPADPEYLRAIKNVSDATKSPYYSDHLAMTHAPGIEIGHLSPLWFTHEALEVTTLNVSRAQDVLEKPLVLENVTYMFELPSAQMTQAEFLTALVEETGCGVLLDVTNLYTNSVNHKFDPIEFLDNMPLDHIMQIHLAGGYWHDETLVDGHCAEVMEGTWSLLDALMQRTRIRGSILEQDAKFPDDFDTLLEQVNRARNIIAPIAA